MASLHSMVQQLHQKLLIPAKLPLHTDRRSILGVISPRRRVGLGTVRSSCLLPQAFDSDGGDSWRR